MRRLRLLHPHGRVSGYYMGACTSSQCGGRALGETYSSPYGCNTCTDTGSACTEMYCYNDSNPPRDGATPQPCLPAFIISGALPLAAFLSKK